MSSTAAEEAGDLINPSSSSPNQAPSSSPPHLPPPPPTTAATTSSAADPSSPPDASSPTNSPTMTGLPVPRPAPNSSSRRLPPPCWTHEETLALLDSYRDKWYALRKGNLRASHWQEVAEAVARRCVHLPSATPKTSVQCRHKIEKLRKRYRSERTRSLSHDPTGPPTSSWVYFRMIDLMENGTPGAGAASAGVGRTPSSPPSSSSPSVSDDDDDENPHITSQKRSLHRLMANGAGSVAPPPAMPMGFRFTVPKAVRSKISGSRSPAGAAPSSSARFFFKGYTPGAAAEEIRRRVERQRQRERESEPMTESAAAGHVATALRALADGFMRVEYTKMDMAKEIEKVRMDMELKRTKMILDTQRHIVDAFVKGLQGRKRAKLSPEP